MKYGEEVYIFVMTEIISKFITNIVVQVLSNWVGTGSLLTGNSKQRETRNQKPIWTFLGL